MRVLVSEKWTLTGTVDLRHITQHYQLFQYVCLWYGYTIEKRSIQCGYIVSNTIRYNKGEHCVRRYANWINQPTVEVRVIWVHPIHIRYIGINTSTQMANVKVAILFRTSQYLYNEKYTSIIVTYGFPFSLSAGNTLASQIDLTSNFL